MTFLDNAVAALESARDCTNKDVIAPLRRFIAPFWLDKGRAGVRRFPKRL
jgi:hypothetical protein